MQNKALVMLVEDSKLYLQYLKNLCTKYEYDYIIAEDGIQAIEMLFTARPDLILLDIELPGMNGYNVCKHIRKTPSINQIPIIFLTGDDSEDGVVEGFKLGGNDYVTKPFNEVVLMSRVKNQLEQVSNKKLLNDYIYELELINNALKKQKEHSEYLASRDHLTGTYNRRYLQTILNDLIRDNEDDTCTFSLALFDIDDFKSVNDTYGHPCGDYVLKAFVASIESLMQNDDLLARWGGEEFLLYMPNTSSEDAFPVVDSIRQAISEQLMTNSSIPFHITTTCGLSEYVPGEAYKEIFNRIDEALYYGKQHGKDQVVTY